MKMQRAVADEILRIRRKSGLTQEEFAKYTGFAQQEIALFEKSKRNLTLCVIEKLFEKFNQVPRIVFMHECKFKPVKLFSVTTHQCGCGRYRLGEKDG